MQTPELVKQDNRSVRRSERSIKRKYSDEEWHCYKRRKITKSDTKSKEKQRENNGITTRQNNKTNEKDHKTNGAQDKDNKIVVKNLYDLPRFPCEKCPSEFFHYSSRRLHQKMHHPSTSTHMSQLKSVIPSNQGKVERSGKRLYQCSRCQKQFSSFSLTRRHISSAHDRRWCCGICLLKFNCLTKLNMHKTKSHGHRIPLTSKHILRCDVCSMGFIHKKNLDNHNQLHHKNDAPVCVKKVCRHCRKSFYNHNCFVTHLTSHGLKNRDLYKELVDPDPGYLFQALPASAVKSEGEFPYHCTQCDATYRDKATLNNHSLRYHGVRIMTRKAPLTTREKIELSMENNKKRFKCEECLVDAAEFDTYAELNRHLTEGHAEVNYECLMPKCSYKTKIRSKFHV